MLNAPVSGNENVPGDIEYIDLRIPSKIRIEHKKNDAEFDEFAKRIFEEYEAIAIDPLFTLNGELEVIRVMEVIDKRSLKKHLDENLKYTLVGHHRLL